jgi:VWFA-related protein
LNRTAAVLPVLAFLAGASTAGQTPARTAPAQPPFRASTTLVEVDTIVTDGNGRFVDGLTADDFEVDEDGKPQKIERIYLVAGSSVRAVGSLPTSPAGSDSLVAPSTPAAPQRVFVLVFDQEHLQEGPFKRIRDAAVSFLTSEFRPGDVGGVVVGGTMVGNQLTSDRETLLRAIRDAKPSAAKTSRRLELLEWPRLNSEAEAIRIALANDREVLAQAVRRACQDDPQVCTKVSPEPMVMEKARSIVADMRPGAARTVAALQALASGLGRLPGRKTIVLMTEGFFIEESWADLRRIVGAAARSNVRIYSLDARGLDTRQTNDLRQLSVMDPGGSMPLEAYNTAEDGPNMLAVDTGGYAIRHTNMFGDALAEIARDTSTYYVIGYSPPHPGTDGSFHRITVRVKRPGLKVRARRGYLASASSAAIAAPATPQPSARSTQPESAPAASSAPPSADPVASSPAPAPASADASAAEPAAASRSTGVVALRPDSTDRVRELASRGATLAASTSAASRGWDRYQQGDLEGAAEWLRKAVAEPSAHPWVHYALGYSELALRHPEKAAREWEGVRTAVPEFRAVYLDLADAYVQLDRLGSALDVLRAADARWPGDVDVLNATGTIQVRRGALNDALNTFRKAADSKPDDGIAYLNLGRTYELRYFKTRRYMPNEGRWLANAADLRSAVASYEAYLKVGGPYESQAREAIEKLQWIK